MISFMKPDVSLTFKLTFKYDKRSPSTAPSTSLPLQPTRAIPLHRPALELPRLYRLYPHYPYFQLRHKLALKNNPDGGFFHNNFETLFRFSRIIYIHNKNFIINNLKIFLIFFHSLLKSYSNFRSFFKTLCPNSSKLKLSKLPRRGHGFS